MIWLGFSIFVGIVQLQGGFVQAQTLGAELCDKFASANSTVVPFSYSNNAWGNDTGLATGYQCTRVYNDGELWISTYKWTGEPSLVKGYPRMRAHPSNMPLQLRTLSQVLVDVDYRTYLTNGGDSDQAYSSAGLVANVAMDLFVASTADDATRISPPTEIMVWPWWTPTILPLGYDSSTPEKDTIQVNGVTWSLYHGINDGGQNVFSWLARSNITSMKGDYGPLFTYLIDNNYLSGDLWASQLQLGQEMKMATQETNFRVDARELRIVRADEGEMSVVVQATTPTPVPTSSTLPPSTPPLPSSSSETALVTTVTVAPAPPTTTIIPVTTTTTVPPSSPPQTSLSSTSPPAPATTTTTNPPATTPEPTTIVAPPTTTISVAPETTTTTTSAAPETTTVRTTSVVPSTTSVQPTTSVVVVTTTMTTATSQAVSTTEVAPTTTTSNAATSIAKGLEDSWFMVIMALVAGFL